MSVDRDFYWKNFESTGSVLEYLHYKQAQQAAQETDGEDYADSRTRPGPAPGETEGE